MIRIDNAFLLLVVLLICGTIVAVAYIRRGPK